MKEMGNKGRKKASTLPHIMGKLTLEENNDIPFLELLGT